MIDGGEHINIVSYGGGANSTALLIGLHQHRIPVDLILFADTGGEHPHTYAYLDIMDRWLKDHGNAAASGMAVSGTRMSRSTGFARRSISSENTTENPQPANIVVLICLDKVS